jgi:phytoene dehydrogenase-like protein
VSGLVVGSGPNGMAAAIVLAQAGLRVTVLEAEQTFGGGTRSADLTLPGFVHDVCSAVHPLAVGSPFFRELPLREHGLEWVQPPAPLAHPLDDGTAVMLERSLDATCDSVGEDGPAYRALMQPLIDAWPQLLPDVLAPARFPRNPFAMAQFGVRGIRDARALAESIFCGARAQALFAGLAAHSMLPLEMAPSAAFALLLGAAGHVVGWPVPRGGSQKIANALASYFGDLGGEVRTGVRVRSVDELEPARIVLCDVTPRQLLDMAGHRFTEAYRRKLARYRYGPGAYKVDWALAGPIPWRATECARAGTVHLGGTFDEIAESEHAAWYGKYTDRPFVLLAQPSLFDSSRAPEGRHTAWAYCHVPNGSTVPMLEQIEAQVERFAPGFRELVLARSVMAPADLEARNANLVGGDIGGGAADLAQLFLRPSVGMYSTPCKGLYICSASTPPGGGVHGMCGYFAAQRALRDCRGG